MPCRRCADSAVYIRYSAVDVYCFMPAALCRCIHFQRSEFAGADGIRCDAKGKEIFNAGISAILPFFAGVLCLSTTNGFTETYLPQIIHQIGGTNSDFGVATFISAIVEMPAMFLYRRFADKAGNRRLLIFAGWMWALKNFLIMLAPTTYLIFAAEPAAICGLCNLYTGRSTLYCAYTSGK